MINHKKLQCPFKQEMKLGQKIEMEHHMGLSQAKKIASDHIKEFPCYYSRGLIPMEKRLSKMKGG